MKSLWNVALKKKPKHFNSKIPRELKNQWAVTHSYPPQWQEASSYSWLVLNVCLLVTAHVKTKNEK